MNKINLNQVLLIGIATAVLLLTAASFYLLQDPSAPLPFAAGSPVNTLLPTNLSSTSNPVPSSTPLPTRQTSYTPFVSVGTPISGTVALSTITPGGPTPEPTVVTSPGQPTNTLAPGQPTNTLAPGQPTNTLAPGQPTNTTAPGQPTSTFTPQPTLIPTRTPTPTLAGDTAVPTPSSTFIAGEHEVTGRIVQNGTPLPNVKVIFVDDNPPRQATTNQGGHYSFTTLAPGTHFTLQFSRVDNPQVTPVAEVASVTWIDGNLPTGVDVITLPDLEVSLNIDGMIFGLDTPIDGATYSAAAISPNNPLKFIWSLYDQGEYYFVEIGQTGNELPVWTSDTTTATDLMWNGILESGDQISEGTYWWHVGVKITIAPYDVFIFTPDNDLLFNP